MNDKSHLTQIAEDYAEVFAYKKPTPEIRALCGATYYPTYDTYRVMYIDDADMYKETIVTREELEDGSMFSYDEMVHIFNHSKIHNNG